MTEITIENLLAAGYRRYTGPFGAGRGRETTLYQKRVTDDVGIRYHLTFYHGVYPINSGRDDRSYFYLRDQFTREGMTFNVELILHNETIEQVEAFWASVWTSLSADYYEDKQGDRRAPQPLVAPAESFCVGGEVLLGGIRNGGL